MTKRFLPVLLIVLGGCVISLDSSESSSEADDIVRQEWPNGNLKMEVPTKNKKKHGTAKSYYENGKLKQEIEYVDGLKNGKSVYYYKDGKPYRVSNYLNNNLHGVRSVYRNNGNLMAEIPYNNGFSCSGLKEYLVDGSPKKKYPKLRFREVDEILTRGLYTVEVSLTENMKKVEFYRGELGEGGCFDPNLAQKIIPQREDKLSIYFPMPKGTFIMEEIKMFVKITTTMGNPYYIEGTHNLAVENR